MFRVSDLSVISDTMWLTSHRFMLAILGPSQCVGRHTTSNGTTHPYHVFFQATGRVCCSRDTESRDRRFTISTCQTWRRNSLHPEDSVECWLHMTKDVNMLILLLPRCLSTCWHLLLPAGLVRIPPLSELPSRYVAPWQVLEKCTVMSLLGSSFMYFVS
jgi:hypothetical protein